jgi:hypothetical protein
MNAKIAKNPVPTVSQGTKQLSDKNPSLDTLLNYANYAHENNNQKTLLDERTALQRYRSETEDPSILQKIDAAIVKINTRLEALKKPSNAYDPKPITPIKNYPFDQPNKLDLQG